MAGPLNAIVVGTVAGSLSLEPIQPLTNMTDKCPKSKKVMYTKEEGERTAKILNQYGKKLRTYFCLECHTWHLTKAGGVDDPA